MTKGEKISVAMKLKCQNDPEWLARRTAALRVALQSKECIAKKSAAAKKSWSRKSYRTKMSAAMRAAWADEEKRAIWTAAYVERWNRPGQRQAASERSKAMWNGKTPEQKAHIGEASRFLKMARAKDAAEVKRQLKRKGKLPVIHDSLEAMIFGDR